MMMMTATTLATGPSIDSRMRCSGASHGMPEPAALRGIAWRSAPSERSDEPSADGQWTRTQ